MGATRGIAIFAAVVSLHALACGHSDAALTSKDNEINRLRSSLQAANEQSERDAAKLDDSKKKYDDVLSQVEELRTRLREASVSADSRGATSSQDRQDTAQAL